MIRPSPRIEELERRWARERGREGGYRGALAVFAGLWREARAIAPGFPGDWREDLEADLAVARAINGLPPAA